MNKRILWVQRSRPWPIIFCAIFALFWFGFNWIFDYCCYCCWMKSIYRHNRKAIEASINAKFNSTSSFVFRPSLLFVRYVNIFSYLLYLLSAIALSFSIVYVELSICVLIFFRFSETQVFVVYILYYVYFLLSLSLSATRRVSYHFIFVFKFSGYI